MKSKPQTTSRSTSHPGRLARAFTLIELLVVVAVIAILIGILLPALGRARAAGFQLQDSNNIRQFVLGMSAYAAGNDQWIPGVNSSGRKLFSGPTADIGRELTSGSTRPVQAQDWMTPSVADEGMPDNRQARFFQMFERFGDPAQRERVPVWTGGGAGSMEMTDWLNDNGKSLRGVSHLMPARFQLFGGPAGDGGISNSVGIYAQLLDVFEPPSGYRPRLESIGNLSIKVAVADGFRFISVTNNPPMDTDTSYKGGSSSGLGNWGSFLDRSPVDATSTAWGKSGGSGARDTASAGSNLGAGLPFSYRHSNRLNVGFFDGHTTAMDRRESLNPIYWTPSRSIFIAKNRVDTDSFNFGIPATGGSTDTKRRQEATIP